MNEVKAVFAVVRSGGLWRLMTPRESHRTFDFQVDAEEAALKLADQAREEGLDPEVLLQDRFGELHPLTSG